MATVWLKTGKPDVGMTGNGLLAGLVGITAGTAAVTGPCALIIGVLAGIIVVFAVDFFDRVVKVDDPVGAISVHGVCGAFGTLCVGLFARRGRRRLLEAGPASRRRHRPARQPAHRRRRHRWPGSSVTAGHPLLRASRPPSACGCREEEELAGLDILEHGSPGYGEGFGTFTIDSPLSDNGETTTSTDDEPVPA